MSDLWFSSAGWFTQTALAGGFVLALGWLLARKAAPEATRSVSGWSVRGAVLASGLCLLPGWITLPTPDWAKSTPAPSAAAPAPSTPDFVAVKDPTSTDVVEDDDGSWVIVDVPAEALVPAATSASWVGSKRDSKSIELTVAPAETPVVDPRPVRGLVEDVARVVLVAYGIGLAFALGQLMLAQVALARIVAAGSRAPGRVQELFAEAADKAGVRARLLLSNRVASPVCFGLWSPTVVLPKHLAQTAYDDELKWVFAHELDHLKRGDHRLAWWVGVARALYYFVPSFWAVRRQLGLAQEYLADAAAAATGHPADYAQFLVTLSSAPIDRRAARHPLTATGVRAGRSDLFRRVNMLVNAAHSPTKPSRLGTTLAGGVTLGAAVLLSGFGFAADEPKKADAPPAESTSEKVPIAGNEKADDKADKAAAEAKAKADEARTLARKAQAAAEAAARDAERAQADAVRAAREASRTTETTTRNVLTARLTEVNSKEIETLKKAIAEAAKKGDAEAVNAAAEKLAKLAAAQATRPLTVTGRLTEMQPPKAPAAPAAPKAATAPVAPKPPTVLKTWAGQSADATKAAHDMAIKHFKAAMDKVKDNPEAKAELEKAIAEFQKAMEKAKKEMPQAMEWIAPMKGDGQNFRVQNGQDFKFVPFQGQGTFTTTAGGEGGRLGVTIQPVSPEDVEKLGLTKGVGIKVVEVKKDTPAAKAGIKKDDIILELAGKTIPGEPEDVVKLLAKVEKDATVNVVVVRDGKRETIKGVVLPEAKATKVRVLETMKDGQHPGHFEMKVVPGHDEKELKLQIENLHKQIENLHKVAPKAGGKLEGKNVQMSVSVNDGDYTINAKKDGVSYDIKGSADGGPSSIVIKDGDKTVKAKSVENLPEEYRADVKKMLGQVKISKDQK